MTPVNSMSFWLPIPHHSQSPQFKDKCADVQRHQPFEQSDTKGGVRVVAAVCNSPNI